MILKMLRPLIYIEHFGEAGEFSIGTVRLELIYVTHWNVNIALLVKYFFKNEHWIYRSLVND